MEAGFMINIIKKHTFSSDEYRNDKKVERYLNEKWIEYLNVNSINEKDEAKII